MKIYGLEIQFLFCQCKKKSWVRHKMCVPLKGKYTPRVSDGFKHLNWMWNEYVFLKDYEIWINMQIVHFFLSSNKTLVALNLPKNNFKPPVPLADNNYYILCFVGKFLRGKLSIEITTIKSIKTFCEQKKNHWSPCLQEERAKRLYGILCFSQTESINQ